MSAREANEVPSTTLGSSKVMAFTAAQRRALVGGLSIFILILIVALIRNPQRIDDPMPAEPSRFGELADRIDPNTADVATLSALPALGPKRAKDIVDYREHIRAVEPNRIVFTTLDDLMRVKGVGYAMTRHAEPYLTFPATRPTTQP